MIDEKEKVYCICEQCSKISTCQYYPEIINVVKEFMDTPLNIHFPQCGEYDSILYKFFNELNNKSDSIDMRDMPEDKIGEIFIENLKNIMTKYELNKKER